MRGDSDSSNGDRSVSTSCASCCSTTVSSRAQRPSFAYRTPASRFDYPDGVNLCGGREILRDEQLADRLLVQGGILGAPGRKPEELAVTEREPVVIRRPRQHVLSHPRRGF